MNRATMFAIFAMIGVAQPAVASTSCPTHVVEVKSSADGSVEFHFDQAAPFAIPGNSPIRDELAASALTALVSGRSVLVVFGTDNAGCFSNSGLRGDFNSLSLIGS